MLPHNYYQTSPVISTLESYEYRNLYMQSTKFEIMYNTIYLYEAHKALRNW